MIGSRQGRLILRACRAFANILHHRGYEGFSLTLYTSRYIGREDVRCSLVSPPYYTAIASTEKVHDESQKETRDMVSKEA